MKLAAWLGSKVIRLYPGAWRARYGHEFAALLEDRRPEWSDLFDLLKGAVQMQFTVQEFARLAFVWSLAGLAAGAGISWLVTPTYVSTATMNILAPTAKAVPGVESPATAYMQNVPVVTSRTVLSAIIQDPRLDLYKAMRATTPLEDVIEHMKRDLTIEPLPRSIVSSPDLLTFRIRFRYDDPRKAQAVVQTLVVKLQESSMARARQAGWMAAVPDSDFHLLVARVALLEKMLGLPPKPEPNPYAPPAIDTSRFARLEVLDPPSLPERSVAPNRTMFGLYGFGAGFLLATVLYVIRRSTVPPTPATA